MSGGLVRAARLGQARLRPDLEFVAELMVVLGSGALFAGGVTPQWAAASIGHPCQILSRQQKDSRWPSAPTQLHSASRPHWQAGLSRRLPLPRSTRHPSENCPPAGSPLRKKPPPTPSRTASTGPPRTASAVTGESVPTTAPVFRIGEGWARVRPADLGRPLVTGDLRRAVARPPEDLTRTAQPAHHDSVLLADSGILQRAMPQEAGDLEASCRRKSGSLFECGGGEED